MLLLSDHDFAWTRPRLERRDEHRPDVASEAHWLLHSSPLLPAMRLDDFTMVNNIDAA